MHIFHAIILGVVEGLTEFLPVSSTAHLIFASKFLGISQNQFTTFFEVFIQSGAILAVVLLYFKYIFNHRSLILNLLVSFIPTAIIGLMFHKVIKTVFFESQTLILSAFLLIGIIFLIVEWLVKNNKLKLSKTLSDVNYKQAFLIGLLQSFAIVPGISRAGAVIVAMMFMGYKRDESAKYSFLLAVPTIFAASVFDLLKTDKSLLTNSNLTILLIGFIVSFLSALVVIKWLVGFLQKNTLNIFGVYRVIATVLLFFFQKS